MSATAILASIQTSAEVLGVSTSTIRRLIAKGQLPSVKVGSRVLVPTEALTSFAAQASTARAVRITTPPARKS